jgi:queuosine precursor transporter
MLIISLSFINYFNSGIIMRTAAVKRFKYYDLIMAAFVTILLCSNIIGAEKVVNVWGFSFGAGILFFPISYFFNDILTEVYGYARSRKVVWAGFAALGFASFMAWVVVTLPPAAGWVHQDAYIVVFGQTPRIVIASLLAFFSGEFVNSYVLAKMKIFTTGKFLWMRTIGSTVAGEAMDSLIFYPIAFYGFWPNSLLLTVMLTNYVLKVTWEVVATPLTYKVVGFLKRKEHEDYYDRDTNFTPFSIEV